MKYASVLQNINGRIHCFCCKSNNITKIEGDIIAVIFVDNPIDGLYIARELKEIYGSTPEYKENFGEDYIALVFHMVIEEKRKSKHSTILSCRCVKAKNLKKKIDGEIVIGIVVKDFAIVVMCLIEIEIVLSILCYVTYHRMPYGRAIGNSSVICDIQALSMRRHM